MPTTHEVIQVSEEISYPDGYNQVTIEGTGDEGGLGISRYPEIQIYADPNSMSSDGISTSEISVTVQDFQNPDFYKVQELVEVITSREWDRLSVSQYITAITGTHGDGKVMGVYVYDGEDINGDPLLTGEMIVLHEEDPFYRQTIKFREERVQQQESQYVVVYKGVATVSFNVGYRNETWVPVEVFPPVDEPWTPQEPSEPGGTVLPALCPFGRPGSTPGSWIEGKFASGGYQREMIEFMPTAGSSGTATVNVNYDGYQKYVQLQISNGTPLGNANISLTAEPSSIQLNSETSLIELVVITADLHDPVGTPVSFSQYSKASPPEFGAVWWLGGIEKTIGSVKKELEATSSDKRTVSLSYMIETITSIEALPKPTDNWSWTWVPGSETIEGTTIHINQTNEFPIDATPLLIKGTMKGVAQTTVKGTAIGKVILVATVGDATPTTTLTVSSESSSKSFTLKADPTSIGFGETSVVTATFPNGSLRVLYALVPEGENAQKILKMPGSTIGVLSMPNETSIETYTEDVTPSDLRTISVSTKILSVVSITTAHGRNPAVSSFENTTIHLVNALELEDFQTLSVTYTTDCVAVGSYVGPNNKMQVKILGKVYQTDQVQSCSVSTSNCPEYRFDIVSCDPDILNVAGVKKQENIPRIYTSDEPAKVTAILTYTDPNYAGLPEEETLEDRIVADGVWVKIFTDLDKSKSWQGEPQDNPGFATGGVISPDYKYALVKTEVDGKFEFNIHPATGRGETTLKMMVTNSLGQDFEEEPDLFCSITQEITFLTSSSVLTMPTKNIMLASIGVFFQPWNRNKAGNISVGDTIITTEGNIVDFGILEEGADRHGFSTTLPSEDPIHLSYVIPHFYRYWIKKIYLEGAVYDPFLKKAGGSCVRFTGDPGTFWPGPIGPGLEIEIVAPYGDNLRDYSFTVVDASRNKPEDNKSPAPVPGARVELVGQSDAFDRSVVFSGGDGKVTFYGLTPGETYSVNITSEGYRPNSVSAAELQPGSDSDVDLENDYLTIPNFGYSSVDDYRLNEGDLIINVMATIYDTGVDEPDVAPVGGGSGGGGGDTEPPE